MKAANNKDDGGSCPDVILAVPLVHFLRKDLKPFEEPEMTHPRTVKEWCLAEGVIRYKRYSRQVYLEGSVSVCQYGSRSTIRLFEVDLLIFAVECGEFNYIQFFLRWIRLFLRWI